MENFPTAFYASHGFTEKHVKHAVLLYGAPKNDEERIAQMQAWKAIKDKINYKIRLEIQERNRQRKKLAGMSFEEITCLKVNTNEKGELYYEGL